VNSTAWNLVANAVGCGTVNDAAQLNCMKKVPFRTLEDAVISTDISPELVADNLTVFSDTIARGAAGRFAHVPLLTGSNAQEGDIFIVADQLLNQGSVDPILTPILSDILTLTGFTCPAGVAARNRVNAGVPTWRYQYQAIFPDISTRPDLRAFHSSEIPIVFGTFDAILVPPPTLVELALSRYVQGAWVAFARDPARGLLNYGWPRYNPNTSSLALLGNAANATGVVFGRGQSVDVNCTATAPLPRGA